jgi:hypothetical protein
MRALAFLGVDRSDAAVLALDQIHLGDDAELLGGKCHSAGGEVRLRIGLIRRRQAAAAGIDTHMRAPALLGIAGIGPLAIHPFEEGEPRAIDVFVDHARRQQRRLGGGGRRGELEHELGLPRRGELRRDDIRSGGRHTLQSPFANVPACYPSGNKDWRPAKMFPQSGDGVGLRDRGQGLNVKKLRDPPEAQSNARFTCGRAAQNA